MLGPPWQQYSPFPLLWLYGVEMVMAPLISEAIQFEGLLTRGSLLSVTVIALLLFVSIAIIYLSFIDWKDKRRSKK